MPKLFDFDPKDYAERYATKGFVHVPGGLAPAYYDLLAQQVDQHRDANRLADWAIGDKQQGLYLFPDGADYFGEFLATIGAVTGLDPQRLTLSERHIKAYESNADPHPQPHKDRYASQVSVGFSVTVPAGSRLVLYPYDDVWVNPHNTAARLRASLAETPAERVRSARPVVIEDKPGDVLIFKGNAIWHLRENAANTTNVYIKLNDFNCDPLGEDPRSETVRQHSLQLVEGPDEALHSLVPLMGRRVDFFNRALSRDGQEACEVVLWGGATERVTAHELEALLRLGWGSTVGEVVPVFNGGSAVAGLDVVRRLATRGVIDLFESARA